MSRYTGPMVSILIPTYCGNEFLETALKSALKQTYKNIEIIICDDSIDSQNEDMLRKYLSDNKNIKYFKSHNPVGKYNIELYKRCLKMSSGDYVNFLIDCDTFYPRRIEKMMRYLEFEEVSMVTAHRSIIDEKGNVLPSNKQIKKLATVDKIYEGKEFGRKMIIEGNFIGNLTTVLFKRKYVKELGVFNKNQYFNIVDQALWLELLLKGKVVYSAETLSCTRVYDYNKAISDNYQELIQDELKKLTKDAKIKGFITSKEFINRYGKEAL